MVLNLFIFLACICFMIQFYFIFYAKLYFSEFIYILLFIMESQQDTFFFFFPFNNMSQAFPLLLEQRAWNVRICLELNTFFHFLLMTLFSVYPEIVVKIHCKSKQQCSEKFVLSEIGHVQCIVITQFPCWCRLCTIMKYILHLMIPKQLSNCHSTDKSLCSRTFKAAAGSPYFPAEIINRLQIHLLNKPQVFIPKLFLSGRSQLIHCPNILTYSYYFSI